MALHVIPLPTWVEKVTITRFMNLAHTRSKQPAGEEGQEPFVTLKGTYPYASGQPRPLPLAFVGFLLAAMIAEMTSVMKAAPFSVQDAISICVLFVTVPQHAADAWTISARKSAYFLNNSIEDNKCCLKESSPRPPNP